MVRARASSLMKIDRFGGFLAGGGRRDRRSATGSATSRFRSSCARDQRLLPSVYAKCSALSLNVLRDGLELVAGGVAPNAGESRRSSSFVDVFNGFRAAFFVAMAGSFICFETPMKGAATPCAAQHENPYRRFCAVQQAGLGAEFRQRRQRGVAVSGKPSLLCQACSAFLVPAPMTPSTGPGSKPLSFSACCRALRSSSAGARSSLGQAPRGRFLPAGDAVGEHRDRKAVGGRVVVFEDRLEVLENDEGRPARARRAGRRAPRRFGSISPSSDAVVPRCRPSAIRRAPS